MEDYIEISTLNDFVFCPYSIYLHNVYMGAAEDIYYATPQIRGKLSHQKVDNGKIVRKNDDMSGTAVFSEEYGLMGRIDIYKASTAQLIERKQNIASVYKGQIYQLWAQMLCMVEMGYKVESISFYDIGRHRQIPVDMPSEDDLVEFRSFLDRYRNFRPGEDGIQINQAKCRHCIYCNLCDKANQDNVYTQGY